MAIGYRTLFSPDDKTLVSSSIDKTIKLWNVKTKKCKLTLIGHEASVWSAVISPDGQIVASTAEDRTIELWNIHTGNCLQTLTGHTEWVKSVSFSPDGEAIATASTNISQRPRRSNNQIMACPQPTN